MKYLSLLLLIGSLMLVLLGLGLFRSRSLHETRASAIIIPVDPTSVWLQNEFGQQRAKAQAELQRLDETLLQQQADLEAQTSTLNPKIREAQQKVQQLQAQQQTLATHLADLKKIQADQRNTYPAELQEARNTYLPHQQQLQAQLDALKTELATIEAQLHP